MKILATISLIYLLLAAGYHGVIGIVNGMFGPVALACVCIVGLDILNNKNSRK